jgi:hypothetical protein
LKPHLIELPPLASKCCTFCNSTTNITLVTMQSETLTEV